MKCENHHWLYSLLHVGESSRQGAGQQSTDGQDKDDTVGKALKGKVLAVSNDRLIRFPCNISEFINYCH